MKKKKKMKDKANLELLLMCLPTLLKTFIFAYIPMVGIIMAFEYYRPATGLLSEWVGFENFSYIFKSADAKIIFSNTIIYNLLFIVTGLIVALILALFMFEMKSRKLLKMSQMFMFFPFFVSWILAGTLVTSLIGTEGLYTNTLKTLFGIDIAFYSEPKYWRFILVFVNIWKNAGVSAVVYYATLLNIDNEILEAAEMDGAGRLHSDASDYNDGSRQYNNELFQHTSRGFRTFLLRHTRSRCRSCREMRSNRHIYL